MHERRHTSLIEEPAMLKLRPLSIALSLNLALGFALAPAAEAQLANRQALTLEGAKRIMAAAEAEALKNTWPVAIAIVDEAGELLLFHKIDETQAGSIDIAIGKARTAARMKRPTKALEDAVAGGRTVLLAVEGLMPLEGGVPITAGGRVIGAVGVSGVTSQQDAQVAQAGIAALGAK
jgi:glc operon protein GlcG